jgi:inorganic phosphate transporter, PiT family
MSSLLLLVIFVIILALVFDYSNGFHDAANSIATIVATRVLKPYQAVAWAALFNFIAAFTMHTGVAVTVGKGTISKEIVDVYLILACLVGAIGWNVTTWYFGLPTSSSHALIGGLVGAALMKAGPDALVAAGLGKTIQFIVIAPALGMVLGIILMTLAHWILRNAHPGPVNRWSRRLQLVSSGFYSLGHGMNDAQKTMGIIAVLLVSMRSSVPELQNAPAWFMPGDDLAHIPMWIILSAHAAIALGTLSGGWRIVKTMGMRITQLEPVGGVCAETAGAITLIFASLLKVPVSTTHTITGAIVGVGASRRFSAVRWGVAGTIVWAWIITIPAAATVSAITYAVIRYVWPALPWILQVVLGAAVAAGLAYAFFNWLRSARSSQPAHA